MILWILDSLTVGLGCGPALGPGGPTMFSHRISNPNHANRKNTLKPFTLQPIKFAKQKFKFNFLLGFENPDFRDLVRINVGMAEF